MKTPDVTCECGHRKTSHIEEVFTDGYGMTVGRSWLSCEFCYCEGFEPRSRAVPLKPFEFTGPHNSLSWGPRQVARKNEDAT